MRVRAKVRVGAWVRARVRVRQSVRVRAWVRARVKSWFSVEFRVRIRVRAKVGARASFDLLWLEFGNLKSVNSAS